MNGLARWAGTLLLLTGIGCGSPAGPLSETPMAGGVDTTRGAGGTAGTADGDAPLTPVPPSAIVVGTITEVPGRVAGAAFRVEARPETPAAPGVGPEVGGDKYDVTVNSGTVIRRRLTGGGHLAVAAAELRVGIRVEVSFVGPIRESYPMQGTAGRIMIFDP
jgi:hypothetical protein